MREVVSHDRIEQEINRTLEADTHGQDCEFRGIIAELQRPDAEGCNWTVPKMILMGRPQGCTEAAHRAIAAVRQRFNIIT